MDKSDDERRTEKRITIFGVPIYFCYMDDDDPKKLLGIATNTSNSGAHVFTEDSIEEGLDLKVACNALDVSPQVVTIMWCHKVTDYVYSVGLNFK